MAKDRKTADREIRSLLKKYGFRRYEETHPRSKIVPCTFSKKHDDECVCDGKGNYQQRIEWTNATQLWTADIPAGLVMIAEYGGSEFGFYSVSIYLDGMTIDENLDVSANSGYLYATSSSWDGEKAGSAIRRVPETLRGFMWRTCDQKGDHHAYPADIIAYMLQNHPRGK